MSTNPNSNLAHQQFVSMLYSLTGPQENLPKLLMELLDQDENVIRGKLRGELSFSSKDYERIDSRFNNSALATKKIA